MWTVVSRTTLHPCLEYAKQGGQAADLHVGVAARPRRCHVLKIRLWWTSHRRIQQLALFFFCVQVLLPLIPSTHCACASWPLPCQCTTQLWERRRQYSLRRLILCGLECAGVCLWVAPKWTRPLCTDWERRQGAPNTRLQRSMLKGGDMLEVAWEGARRGHTGAGGEPESTGRDHQDRHWIEQLAPSHGRWTFKEKNEWKSTCQCIILQRARQSVTSGSGGLDH